MAKNNPGVVTLRPYQEEAIKKWKENDCKGILSMATGTGKTIIALTGLQHFLSEGKIGLIVVPTKLLLAQWVESLKEFYHNPIIVKCSSAYPSWENKLKPLLKLDAKYITQNGKHTNEARPRIVVSTMGTAYKRHFQTILRDNVDRDDVILVIDEVHHVGAPTYSKILKLPFRKRLGLSATPFRKWDKIGTKKINDYFDGVVFRYTLGDAIQNGYLAPYKYHVHMVPLTMEELKGYVQLSKKIGNIVKKIKAIYPDMHLFDILTMTEEFEEEEAVIKDLQHLLINRRKIIKKCDNKIAAIEDILSQQTLKKCLIYCEDYAQLDQLKSSLLDHGLAVGEYTARLDMDQRNIVLDALRSGHIDYLVSCRCLDEGVDIPNCKSAILLSNSTVEREFIQRRGRILRPHPSKSYANIFDLFVVPYDDLRNEAPVSDAERKILESELERIKFFADDALNCEEILDELESVSKIFKE